MSFRRGEGLSPPPEWDLGEDVDDVLPTEGAELSLLDIKVAGASPCLRGLAATVDVHRAALSVPKASRTEPSFLTYRKWQVPLRIWRLASSMRRALAEPMRVEPPFWAAMTAMWRAMRALLVAVMMVVFISKGFMG